MGHPLLDLVGIGVAAAGCWYGYKRMAGTVAPPPVAPALPNSPIPNANGTATPAQAAAIAQANTAVATGNPGLAQAAIAAADALGLAPSSDLGQAAGSPDTNTPDVNSPDAQAALDDATSSSDDSSILGDLGL
jgi:hypothetical protein